MVDASIRDIVACGDHSILLQLFYADDGAICDNDPARVQSLADAFKDMFERVGLEMNNIKTKAMIVEGVKAPKMQSKAAFDRLHKQEGLIVNAHWRRFSASSVVLCCRDRVSNDISQGKPVREAERRGRQAR